jgi:hypothetical protein
VITAKFDADFNQFNKEVKNAERGLTEMEGGVSKIASNIKGYLLGMLSVGAATAFVKSVLDSASALTELSNQTQISGLELQQMAAAMSDYGISADELGKGMLKLSRGIAGGDDSVASALAKMGLSLKDVQGLKGEELFVKIMNSLGQLKGQLRDTTAVTLFGDKLGAAFAGAAPGIDAALAKVKEFNTFMDDDARKALADYQNAMTDAWTNIKNAVANTIGPLAAGFNTLNEATQRGISLGTQAKAFLGWGKGVQELADALANARENTQAQADATIGAAAAQAAYGRELTAEEQALQFLRTLRSNASKELTDAQVRHLEELRRIGQLNAAHAEGVGVNAQQLKKYTEELERSKKAAADLAAAQREADQLALISYKAQLDNLRSIAAARMEAYGTTAQIEALKQLDAAEQALTRTVYANITSEKDRLALVEQSGIRRREIADQIMAKEREVTSLIAAQLLAEAQAHQQRNAALGLDAQGYTKVTSAAETLRIGLEALNAQAMAGVPITERAALLMDEFARANYEAAKATDQVTQANHQAAQSFEEIAAAMRSEAAAKTANRPTSGGLLPNAIVGHGGVARDMFGRPVVPGGAISGLPVVNPMTINVNSPLGTPDQIAKAVGGALTGSYKSGGGRLPA